MIRVIRTAETPRATLGDLWLDAEKIAVVLEDPAVAPDGLGRIQTGTFRLILSYSRRFKMLLPEIVDVPTRSAIRQHAGNTPADTIGCQLLGTYVVSDHEIGESVLALGRWLARWREWEGRPITIEERFA